MLIHYYRLKTTGHSIKGQELNLISILILILKNLLTVDYMLLCQFYCMILFRQFRVYWSFIDVYCSKDWIYQSLISTWVLIVQIIAHIWHFDLDLLKGTWNYLILCWLLNYLMMQTCNMMIALVLGGDMKYKNVKSTLKWLFSKTKNLQTEKY